MNFTDDAVETVHALANENKLGAKKLKTLIMETFRCAERNGRQVATSDDVKTANNFIAEFGWNASVFKS